jgi:hypothetical protein
VLVVDNQHASRRALDPRRILTRSTPVRVDVRPVGTRRSRFVAASAIGLSSPLMLALAQPGAPSLPTAGGRENRAIQSF